MTTHNLTLIVTTIIPLAAPVRAAPGQDKLSETMRASCLIKITCDAGAFPLNAETVNALLHSAGVGLASCLEVLGEEHTPAELIPVVIRFTPLPAHPEALSPQPKSRYRGAPATQPAAPGFGFGGGGMGGMMGYGGGMHGGFGGGSEGWGGGYSGGFGAGYGGGDREPPALEEPITIVGELVIDTESLTQKGAREFLTLVCKKLEAELARLHSSDLEHMRARVEIAENNAEQADARLQNLQAVRRELCLAAGQNDLSRERILEKARIFEKEQLELEMELIGQQARKDAIQEQISQIGREVEEMENSPEYTELRNREQSLEEKLKELEKRINSDPEAPAETDEIRRELILLERVMRAHQQEMSQPRAAHKARLQELTGELAALSIDVAEGEARGMFIAKQLGKTRDLLESADQYERQVAIGLPLAMEACESARLRVEALQRRIRGMHPPTVTVLGGE